MLHQLVDMGWVDLDIGNLQFQLLARPFLPNFSLPQQNPPDNNGTAMIEVNPINVQERIQQQLQIRQKS